MICRHNRQPTKREKQHNVRIPRASATPQHALLARLAGTREKCRVGDRIRTRDLPWNEVLRPEESRNKQEKNRKYRNNRKWKTAEEGPRPAQRRKSGEAKEVAITPWPCCLERWHLATQHHGYQEHTTRAVNANTCSLSKLNKLEHWFSNSVSAILNNVNLRPYVDCKDNESTCIISV